MLDSLLRFTVCEVTFNCYESGNEVATTDVFLQAHGDGFENGVYDVSSTEADAESREQAAEAASRVALLLRTF